MRKFAKDKGITLIALVITIIVLLILTTIGYHTGRSTINNAKFSTYKSEMTAMQHKVNELAQEYKNGDQQTKARIDAMGETVPAEASTAFSGAGIPVEEQSGYKYYSHQTLKELGIDNTENEFLINIQKRSVISLDGIEHHGETVYSLDQVPDEIYNVAQDDTIISDSSFSLNTDIQNGMKIVISNITYTGDIKKGTVYYGLVENGQVTNWIKAGGESTNTSQTIEVLQEGTYKVKIIDAAGNESNVQEATVHVPNYQIVETGKKYVTIEDSINASENNQTIKQLRNYTDVSEAIVNNKSIIFDNNGKTLTKTENNIVIINNAQLEIKGNGTINISNSIYNQGRLNVSGGTINHTNTSSSPTILNYGMIDITEEIINTKASSASAYAIMNYNTTDILNIKNSTINVESTNSNANSIASGIFNNGTNAPINIEDTSINVKGIGGSYGIFRNVGNTTISQTTLTNVNIAVESDNSAYGFYSSAYENVTKTGGDITAISTNNSANGIYLPRQSTLVAENGTITAKGSGNSYGILMFGNSTDDTIIRNTDIIVEGSNAMGIYNPYSPKLMIEGSRINVSSESATSGNFSVLGINTIDTANNNIYYTELVMNRVEIKGKGNTAKVIGINNYGNVIKTGGSIDVTSTTGSVTGINAERSSVLTVEDEIINATGGSQSDGIIISGKNSSTNYCDISLKNIKVIVEVNSSQGSGRGIYTEYTRTFSSNISTINVKGANSSYGIYIVRAQDPGDTILKNFAIDVESINSYVYGIYSGNKCTSLRCETGTVKVKSKTSSTYGISFYAYDNENEGTFDNVDVNVESESGNTYGIYSVNSGVGLLNVNGVTISSVTSNYSSAYGIKGAISNINGTKIYTESANSNYGLYADYYQCNSIITDTEIEVYYTGTSSGTYVWGVHFNGGYNAILDNIKISVNSKEEKGTLRGVDSLSSDYITIKSGTIIVGSGSNTNDSSVGVYGTHISLGDLSTAVNTEDLVIQAETYGVRSIGADFNFYNGILKGTSEGYAGTVNNIRSGYSVATATETIDGITYQTAFLGRVYSVDDSTYAGTLAEAIATASNGSTIKLLANTLDSSTATFDKNITLDLQNYTLKRAGNTTATSTLTINIGYLLTIQGTGTITSNYTTITNNGSLNIANGNIITTSNSSSEYCIFNNGSLIVDNGRIKGGSNAINNSASTATSAATATVVINGGTVEAGDFTSGYYGIYNYGTSSAHTKTATVNGGTVKGKTAGLYNSGSYATSYIGRESAPLNNTSPVMIGAYGVYGAAYFYNGILKGTTDAHYSGNTPNCRAGCGLVTGTEEIDGTTYKTEYLSDKIYSITDNGNTSYYITLASAVATVTDGQTIKLLENVKDTSSGTINKNITLDLQNYTLARSNGLNINRGYTVNIQGTGTLTCSSITIANNGTLNIRDCTIMSTSSNYVIGNTGTLTINSGKITGLTYGINNNYSDTSTSSLTINGGTVETTSTSGTRYPINNSSGTNSAYTRTVTINGGTVKGGTYGVYNNGAYSTTNIGNSGDTLSTSIPTVIGEEIGVYNDSGTWNFYNGIIMGNPSAYITSPAAVRSGYGITTENQLIDDKTYNVAYLETGRLILSNTGGTIVKGNSTTATVTGNNVGSLTCVSGDSSVATASISGNVLTVTGTGEGNTTITVTESNENKTAVYFINVRDSNFSITESGNTTYYNNLAEAIGGATTGQTIKLIQDATDSPDVTIDKDITLDLQNFTLTRTTQTTINSGQTLNLRGTGKLTNTSSNNITLIRNNGTLNITENTILENVYSGTSAYVIYNTGAMNISNGTFSAWSYGIYNYNCNRTVNITGGTIQTKATTGTRYGIYNYQGKGVINISGGIIQPLNGTAGTIYGIYNTSTSSSYRSVVNITGGTIIGGTSGTGYGVYNNGAYATTIIGSEASSLSTNTPLILGATNGIYKNSGKWCFYNGIVGGKSGAGYNAEPSQVRDRCKVETGTKEVDGITYNTAYLTESTFYVTPRFKSIGTGRTDTITVGGTGYGAITASSSNTSIATVSVSGNTITINGVAEGTCTITVTEGTNNKTDKCNIQVSDPNYSITTAGTKIFYKTLALANTDAKDGDIIKLEQNATDTATVTIDKNITLDLQTYTVTRTTTVAIGSNIEVTMTGSQGGKLTSGTTNVNTITNQGVLNIDGDLTIEHNGTSTSYYAITNSYSGAILNVKSGTISSASRGIYNNNDTAVTNIGDPNETVNISNPVIIGATYGIYRNKGTVNFNSGIIKGKSGAYTGTINLRNGYGILPGTEVIGGVTYQTAHLAHIYIVDDTTYANTLSDAVQVANDGSIIKLLTDFTDPSSAMTINQDITLDLQTYTLTKTATVTIGSGKNVTITGDQGGKYSSGTANLNTIMNNGILTIDGDVTIEHNGTNTSYFAIYNATYATLNVKSGTISSVTRSIYNYNNTTVTNIGDPNETVNTSNPVIIGGTYGIYKNDGTVNLYSGILKGKTAGYYGRITPRSGYRVNDTGTEAIDGATYHTAYLEQQ